MRDAVYLAMSGAVPSFEVALEMDEVMRSAAILVAQEIEEKRRLQMIRAIGGVLGVQ